MAKQSFTRDPCLDALLDLDGELVVIDAEGRHWVKFGVKLVETARAEIFADPARRERGRLVGFDNAHAVGPGTGPGAGKPTAHDHRHRLRIVRPYDYRDAGDLLADFWNEVEAVLAERGVKL